MESGESFEKFCSNINDKDYRIFFTGHKGFHIEIHPKVIAPIPNIDRICQFNNKRKEINKRFGDCFCDVLHDHVRLHNSINSWINHSGVQVCAMNYEISNDELFNCYIDEISDKAKKLIKI